MGILDVTIKELIENLNANLQDLFGSPTKSALATCQTVREMIQENDFYKELQETGLENILIFRDGLEDMQYIFLRVSEGDEKKIMRINFNISYYDDNDISAGGVLSSVRCELIDTGKLIANLPLSKVISTLQLADIMEKIKKCETEIKEIHTVLEEKEKQVEIWKSKENELTHELAL